LAQKLVIHLGDRKTGSTSVQAALRRKTWRGGESLGFPVKGLHHQSLVKGLAAPRGPKRAFKSQARLLAQCEAQTAVISSENFEDADPFQLKAAIERYFPEHAAETRLIAYVRPHVDRVVSSWAERTKLGLFLGDLDTFFLRNKKKGSFLYAPRFQRWREAFGERFELRPMMREHLHQNCVVRDFLRFALQTEQFELLEEPQANVSLSVEDLALMREYHGALIQYGMAGPGNKSAQALGRNLGLFLADQPGDRRTKVAAHSKLIPKLQKAYAADAAALDKMFFTGTPMSDALAASEAKAVKAPQSLRPEDHFGPEELRLIRVWASYAAQMSQIAPQEWAMHFSSWRLNT